MVWHGAVCVYNIPGACSVVDCCVFLRVVAFASTSREWTHVMAFGGLRMEPRADSLKLANNSSRFVW